MEQRSAEIQRGIQEWDRQNHVSESIASAFNVMTETIASAFNSLVPNAVVTNPNAVNPSSSVVNPNPVNVTTPNPVNVATPNPMERGEHEWLPANSDERGPAPKHKSSHHHSSDRC